MAELVTLVNRSHKILQGVWDGRHYELAPGKHSFTRIQAEAFRRQNPVMGSGDPKAMSSDNITGGMQYLLGIEELKQDCSPIEQTNSIERWNREQMPNASKVEVVPGKNGLFSAQDVRTDLPNDANFVNPN